MKNVPLNAYFAVKSLKRTFCVNHIQCEIKHGRAKTNAKKNVKNVINFPQVFVPRQHSIIKISSFVHINLRINREGLEEKNTHKQTNEP